MFHVKHPMDRYDVQSLFGLSSDVIERLEIYVTLLAKWQPKINLVGPDTMGDVWRRHIADSAQLFALIPEEAKRLADLGSGAGFPGLVLAIMGDWDVHLVESDQRKGAFLREVARATDTKISLHCARAESLEPLAADVVSARALAPLTKLLPLARRHLKSGGICLFPKGKNAEDELTDCLKESTIAVERTASMTDPLATVFRIRP